MDKLTLTLLLLLCWLQYLFWQGKNGVHDFMLLKREIATQKCNNMQLKARNDRIFAEINDLNKGKEAIEERSRNELGMIKYGETFYLLVSEEKKRQSAPVLYSK